MKTSFFTKMLSPMLFTLGLLIAGLLSAGKVEACGAKAVFTIKNGANGKVTFTNGSSTSSSGFRSIWDFEDKTSSRDKSPNHTYTKNGVYHICLTVTDSVDSTCTASYCLYDTVTSVACTANVVGGASKLTAGFSDSGSTALSHKHSASWNFGDGTSSGTGDYVSHTFAKNGIYNVCVTVYDSSISCTATQCKSITVSNGCNNIAGYSYTTKGKTITFRSNSSTSAHTRFKWNFGDGTSDSTSGFGVTHTYTTSLTTVTASLTIYDSLSGCTASYSGSIAVCKAISDYTYTVNALSVAFRADSAMKGSPNIVYSWDFGDKSSPATTYDPTHTYSSDGTYHACLTVTDTAAKCNSSYCGDVSVTHCILTASISNTVLSSTSMKFTAGTNGSSHVKVWWGLGDGTYDSTSGLSLTHVYTNAAAYEIVSVEIYDSATKCYATTHETFYFCTVKADFTYSISGSTVNVKGDSANLSRVKYEWSFGDKAKGSSASTTHTYASTGTYHLCLTAIDSVTACAAISCDSVKITSGCNLSAAFSDSIDNHKVKFSGKTNASLHSKITWIFGDGNSDSTSGLSVTHTYASTVVTANVYMRVYDSTTKCVTYASATINLSFCIVGNVTTDKTAGYPAKVYLITYNSSDSSLHAVDSTTTNSNGLYEFCGLTRGTYYTKAALDTGNPYYKYFIPTYHNDATKWAAALKIVITNNSDSAVNIAMKKGTNPGGTGFIAGKISAGAGKSGDPEANILVVLYDANSNPVMYTYSNSSGEYSFANLAFGTYDVYGEVLGKLCYPAVVTLSDTAAKVNNVNLLVNPNSITAAIKPIGEWTVEKADIYPNPVTEKLTVSMSLHDASPVNIRIYDITGKVVSELNTSLDGGAQKMEVNASSLPAGLYFLRMEMLKDNTLMEAQFVKAR